MGRLANAANVDKVSARLTRLSYAAPRRRTQGSSVSLVTVIAGLFDTADAARKARLVLRAAGFGDAMVMGR